MSISLVPEYDDSSDDDEQDQQDVDGDDGNDSDGPEHNEQDQQDVDGDDGNDSDGPENNEQMHHAFWETQPVKQFNEILNITLPEGPIQLPIPDVEPEPLQLPVEYEWVTDLNPEMVLEVSHLLTNHYADQMRNDGFQCSYTREFLDWVLRPPGLVWHLGVRVRDSKLLIGFISAVAQRIRVGTVVYQMPKVSYFCIHETMRSQGLAPVNGLAPLLMLELKRRINLENIWQAAYFAENLLPTPFTICKFWAKLFELEAENFQDKPVTVGFRRMESKDIPAVTQLLRNYLSQFAVAIDYDEIDVEHWLLPRVGVVDSYVVELPETKEVTDFCSFYQVRLLTENGIRPMCAFSLYNVATKTPFVQLMNDALIISERRGFGMFCASDVMENEKFVKELQFTEGYPYDEMYYYLYNYRMPLALKLALCSSDGLIDITGDLVLCKTCCLWEILVVTTNFKLSQDNCSNNDPLVKSRHNSESIETDY